MINIFTKQFNRDGDIQRIFYLQETRFGLFILYYQQCLIICIKTVFIDKISGMGTSQYFRLSYYYLECLPLHHSENLFGDGHTPCTLSTSFADFDKEQLHCSHYKRIMCSSLPYSPYISCENLHLSLSSISFIYIVELVLLLNIQ